MRVDESTGSPPALGTVGSPNQATSYSYSALDNLTRVTQGSQSRTFVYDSLSRLTSATNPESGTTSFSYDKNDNLTEKTDARGVETTYTYDALNRLTARSYSYTGTDSEVSLETTQVDYDYDNCGAYSEGQLCSVTAKKGTAVVSTTAYANYDALGRVGKSTQTMGVTDYEMFYTYDRAGNLTSQTYPSGKVVETVYDEVGRVAGVKRGGHWYAGAAAGATGAVGYEPHGGIRELRLGNGLWEQRRYNARLQPTQIGLGTVEATGDTLVATATGTVPTAGLLLNYSYGTTANNGNVVSQQIQVGDSLDQTQTYTYDKLNRLKTATETGRGTGWMQTYQYDRYGNRAVTGADSYLPMTDHTLTPQALTSFNTSSNRLNGLVAYDGAGNLTQDWAGRNFKYDGDNRMVDFRFTAGGVPTHVKYRYDGEGRRIQKEVVGGRTTTYVYNAAGQLVAEYAGTVPPALRYLTPDHLGSTRVVTAADQAQDQGVLTRHDYLPFGQEIEPSRGNRTTVSGYTADLADGPAQKFTGKERDTESRLDYFNARYYSGVQGRFTSADPLVVPRLQFEDKNQFAAFINNPQNWNKYVYARNNPLRNIDPDGLQTRELNEEELRRIYKGARESSSDSVTALFSFLHNLGDDVSASGEDVQTVLSESGDTPEKAMMLLKSAKTLSKKGRKVTITNSEKKSFDTGEESLTGTVDKTVEFRTSSRATVTHVKGIGMQWEGLTIGGVQRMKVVSKEGVRKLKVISGNPYLPFVKDVREFDVPVIRRD